MGNPLTSIVKRLFSSSFVKDVATLASGTTLAQVFNLCTAPILYRIYPKEAYGVLGVFLATAAFLEVFSNLQFAPVILMEKNERDLATSVWLNRLSSLLVSVLLLAAILVLHDDMAQALGQPAVGEWLLLLPLTIFLSGQNSTLRAVATRQKAFGVLSVNTVLNAVLVPIATISLGLYLGGAVLGLFVGYFMGQLVSLVVISWSLSHLPALNWRQTPAFSELVALLKKHVKFLQYSLPAGILNSFSHQIPVFAISRFDSLGAVAAFRLGQKLLGLPSGIIAGSIGEVFRQRASEHYRVTGAFQEVFIKVAKTLLLIGLAPFLVTGLFAPAIVGFVFGEQWQSAGEYAQILAFLYFMRFVVSPLGFSSILTGNQQIPLLMDVLTLSCSLLAFFVGYTYFGTTKAALVLYSAIFGLLYLITFAFNYRFSKGRQ